MDTLTALFYLFAFVLTYAAFRVITAKSPVSAALHLVLAFFNAACVWMLLEAEFLAISLVLVYVGAVMVLFLFVVMMLDINLDSIRQGFWKVFPLAGVIGVVIALEMATVLLSGFHLTEAKPFAPEDCQHQGTGHRPLHQLPVPGADRCCDPAGGHHCCDCADAPRRPQGLQGHQPSFAGQSQEGRPPAHRQDGRCGGAAFSCQTR
jgi:NADH:ubiquinone oxidoreductase subunit 6 (subunit J)